MSVLPLPLRVAAGLVVTAVEQARELPAKAVEWPVTVVSQAMQASMRFQQVVTDLAIKGDRAIAGMRGAPESPGWARFDEDEDGAAEPAATIRTARPTVEVADRPTTELVPRPTAEAPVPAGNGVAELADRRATAAQQAAAAPVSPLPGYDDMTIAQLRARLRVLSADRLRELLVWETEHQNRPPFVTMLTNRIATVSSGDQHD